MNMFLFWNFPARHVGRIGFDYNLGRDQNHYIIFIPSRQTFDIFRNFPEILFSHIFYSSNKIISTFPPLT